MRIGAHVSAAGGLWNAAVNGKKIGCEIIQIFTRPPQGGKAKPIDKNTASLFKESLQKNKIQEVYIHAPYFINLASKETRIRKNSIRIIREELERGSLLGCRALMFHPGSAKNLSQERGADLIVDGINQILDGYTGTCQLLIENSAGAGNVMGDTIEELSYFLKKSERGNEVGVCFDTQHAFASGYDLRDPKILKQTISEFDKKIGIKKLLVFHANDSKVEFNSHKDR
ncbi:deoxyribonuclease IV, partial [Candidatus Parcubacteria bacterium]